MKFPTLLALGTILAGSAEACKCNIDHVNHPVRTQTCCNELGGAFSNGDCAASSISNDLSEFSACCKQTDLVSDCPCPSGCGGSDINEEEKGDQRKRGFSEHVDAVMAETQVRRFRA